MDTQKKSRTDLTSLNLQKLEFNSAEFSQEREQILSVSFNQDYTCLAISTSLGFKVYSLAQQNSLIKLYENKSFGIVSLISMQFRTNILALITRQERLKEEDLIQSQMFVSDSWSVQDYRNSAYNSASHIPRRQFEYEKLIQSMNSNQFQTKMNAMEEESKRAFADKLRAKQIEEYRRRQKIERQRKLTIYDTKGNQSSISVSFYSKILKVEINL